MRPTSAIHQTGYSTSGIPALIVSQAGAGAGSAAVSYKDEPEVYSISSSEDMIQIEKRNGTWFRFRNAVRRVWITKDTIDRMKTDRESLIKTTLRELLIYLTFLATVTVSK